MVLMPILLYPLMGIGFFQIALLQVSKVRKEIGRVAYRGAVPPVRFVELLDEQGEFERVDIDTLDGLQNGEVDVVLEFAEGHKESLKAGGQVRLRVQYDDASERSTAAFHRVQAAMNAYQQEILFQRLASRGLTQEFLNPVAGETQRAATPERRAGYHLGRFLPYLILLMIINGTMYPAIDITAGEKERGTLECLLSSPPSPMEIVLAKFGVVFFFGVLSAVLNLASLGLTAASIFESMKSQKLDEMFTLSISWGTMGMIAVLLVPFTILFAAVLVTIASFADSFKEAQTYIMPLFMVVVLPALVSALPGTELTAFWQIVPIANLCLLMKELFLEQAGLTELFVVFGSSCAYAMGALSLAVRIFSQEEVLFPKEQAFAIFRSGRFFSRPKEDARLLPQAGVSDALMAYAIVFPTSYFISALLGGAPAWVSIALQQWAVILGVPLFLAWFARLNLKETFLMRHTHLLAYAGMFAALAGGVCLVQVYAVFQNQWLPSPAFEKNLADMMRKASGGSLPLLLLLAALSPAICEEMMFRGFVLNGLRTRLSKWQCLIVSAMLFSALHVFIYQLVHTFLLGILLGWIAWETRSLLPGIIFHFVNNAIALTALHYTDYGERKEGLDSISNFVQSSPSGTVGAVVAAATVMVGGCWVVRRMANIRRGMTNNERMTKPE